MCRPSLKYSTDPTKNKEMNSNEVQKVSTFRRVLPQVGTKETRMIRSLLSIRPEIIERIYSTDFGYVSEKFDRFQLGTVCRIPIDCDSIIGWNESSVKSR